MVAPAQSPWLSALAKLNQADQQLLAFDNNTHAKTELDVLDEFGHVAREAYQVCIRKRWHFKLPGEHGKKIIVRDLLGKITNWINVFRSVGDQAAGFDQVHAALPWAGARFLLQVGNSRVFSLGGMLKIATNDFKTFDFAVDGAERISRIVARYRIIERMFLQDLSESTQQLEQALIQLYATILTYLANAKRYFEQNTALRILQSGLLGKSDLHDLLIKMKTDEEEAERWANLVEAEMNKYIASQVASLSCGIKELSNLKNALTRMDQPVLQMSIQLDRVQDHLDNLQRQKILDWLSTQKYGDHHRFINDRVLEGTCSWILRHLEFISWKGNSTNSIMYLHGTQGTGKSCLTSVVVEDGMAIASMNEDCALAYFYCSRSSSEPQRADPRRILGCIARQLSSTSTDRLIAPATLELYDKLHATDGSRTELNIREQVDLILELTRMYSRTTIVVDALDECDPETRWELVDALESVADESDSLVKIFISSREEGDLRLSFEDNTDIQMGSLQNSEDIQKFVVFETDRMVARKQLLGRIKQKATKDELTQLIKENVAAKANGMFRWAEMQLASLRGIHFETDIRAELSKTPRELSALYSDLYRRALENAKDTAQIVLQNTLKWMMCSRRPLPIKDSLQIITSFLDIDLDDFDEDTVLDILSNFVVLHETQEGEKYFRFAHLSVREFLEHMQEYCDESTNAFAAEASLLTLIGCSGSPSARSFVHELGVNNTLVTTFSDTAFNMRAIHYYCVELWGAHCCSAGEKNRNANDTRLKRVLHYFLFDYSDENCPLDRWWHFYRRIIPTFSVSYGWKTNLEKFFHENQQSIERAFYLSSFFGFQEIISMDQFETLGHGQKYDCALAATMSDDPQPLVLAYLLGSINDQRTMEDIIHQVLYDDDLILLGAILKVLIPSQITERMVTGASSEEAAKMLLDFNKEIRITPEFISECIGMRCPMKFYLEREPSLVITSSVLNRIVRYALHSRMNISLFKSLVDKISPRAITYEVIASATGWYYHNSADAEMILKHLLELAGPSIHAIDTAMTCAVMSSYTAAPLRILYSLGWPVSSFVVEVGVLRSTVDVVVFLLEASGSDISARILQIAANNQSHGAHMVEFLTAQLTHPLEDETWRMMIMGATQNQSIALEVLKSLMKLKPHEKISEDILLGVLMSQVMSYGEKSTIMRLMLDGKREIDVTDCVVRFALESLEYNEIIAQVLGIRGCQFVSCEMMLGASRNELFGDQIIKSLLDSDYECENPSTEVIDAVISNANVGYDILLILEEKFGKFDFNDTHLQSAAKSGSVKMLKLILNRQSIKRITPDVLRTAASHASLDALKYLLRINSEPITRDIVIAAVQNYSSGAEKLRLVWDSAPDIQPCIAMFLPPEGLDAGKNLDFLIERIRDVTLGQEVLDAAVTKRDTNAATIASALLDHNIPLRFSYETAKNALRSGNGNIVSLMVKHTPDFTIDQELVDLTVEHEDLDCAIYLTETYESDGLDLTGPLKIIENFWIRFSLEDFYVDD
ncbi:hypothetical protein N7456_005996 [Penicillium angulare]|uniref:Nephrocystin 3-like N-terminal domain-containing protein n=1 Tax=Penicillium angulare TaxID=116970 RepID=A0A9W9KKS7_9EURO|nr:hypothetical protein N7456_005996 [Penicillium angulare]